MKTILVTNKSSHTVVECQDKEIDLVLAGLKSKFGESFSYYEISGTPKVTLR